MKSYVKTRSQNMERRAPAGCKARAPAEFATIADDVVILEKPLFFRAVAESYENWYDVADDEVIRVMQKAKRSDASDRRH